MKRQLIFIATAIAVFLLYLFIAPHKASLFEPAAVAPVQTDLREAGIGREPLLPIVSVPALPPAKVALGDKLFHDPRLSHDNSLACAGCHDLAKGGTDQSRFSVGINGALGDINAPTVFNSSLSIAQFWDGRAKTLEEQAAGPVHNPIEMGSNWKEVIAKLGADSDYPALFEHSYPDGITSANITDAIATFERTLLTPNSRFDRFLRGEKKVLSNEELDGYRRFVNLGCASCHQGVGIGGNMFQRFGVMGDYFAKRQPNKADLGRFNFTGLEEDMHVFKVPSLRNIALTAPYFHDGSAKTLGESVRVMGKYQLGKELSKKEETSIVAFLHTLTGEWRGKGLNER